LAAIQGGAKLKKVDTSAPQRPPAASSSPAGSGGPAFLAELKGGTNKLKKAPKSSPRPPPKATSPTGPSFAELCQLKAKQRSNATARIDDLLAKNKRPVEEKTGVSSELARALARRAA